MHAGFELVSGSLPEDSDATTRILLRLGGKCLCRAITLRRVSECVKVTTKRAAAEERMARGSAHLEDEGNLAKLLAVRVGVVAIQPRTARQATRCTAA